MARFQHSTKSWCKSRWNTSATMANSAVEISQERLRLAGFMGKDEIAATADIYSQNSNCTPEFKSQCLNTSWKQGLKMQLKITMQILSIMKRQSRLTGRLTDTK